ncbi:MAG: hypothetical protein JW870_01860 [Candidatus Delongbacteria bacterium]|nr:hypothetical protein [Candidatus Delongbacteria bacterium]
MDNNSINLIDVLIVLAKKKKWVIISTLLVSIVSVVYVLLVPQYWISSGTFKPISESDQGLSLPTSLLGLSNTFLGSSVFTSSADYLAIMNSRTFSEDVIEHFNLAEYFKIKQKDSLRINELSLKMLQEQVIRFNVHPETGNIRVAAETKDKFLSRDIVNYYLERIEFYNKNIRKSKGKLKREFLEKRIMEIENTIDILKKDLQNFQERTGVIEINKQISELIALYTKLLERKIEVEIEIAANELYYDEDNYKMKILKTTLDKITSEIDKIEIENDIPFVISFSDIPLLANDYSTTYMQLEIQNQVFQYLYPQYESAKIDELKDSPTIEIIDKGSMPGFRSKPKRAKFCIIMFILALITSSLIILTHEYMGEKQKAKLKQFFVELMKNQ